jgi:hypothetical protein
MDESNVFINCPFDNDYFPLLKSILFTLIYIDLNPKISETSDSGQVRIETIKNLMKISRFSIHDLSRMEVSKRTGLPRFNMPFECGIDFGLKFSNEQKYSEKKFLILDSEKYRYQNVISDIAGNDIRSHSNDQEKIIKAVRDWFKTFKQEIPGYKEIYLSFNEFTYDYNNKLSLEGYNPTKIDELTFSDIITITKAWIDYYKKI